VSAPVPDSRARLGRLDAAQRALDPAALLLHERLHVPQRHPARDHDLHAVGVHDDARVARAVGAAHGVGDAVLGLLGHGRSESRNGAGRRARERRSLLPTRQAAS
jgi:hypothetical protein